MFVYSAFVNRHSSHQEVFHLIWVSGLGIILQITDPININHISWFVHILSTMCSIDGSAPMFELILLMAISGSILGYV